MSGGAQQGLEPDNASRRRVGRGGLSGVAGCVLTNRHCVVLNKLQAEVVS